MHLRLSKEPVKRCTDQSKGMVHGPKRRSKEEVQGGDPARRSNEEIQRGDPERTDREVFEDKRS